MSFSEQMNAYKCATEAALAALPMAKAPETLRSAMRYSLLAGGKRLRAVMLLASCEMAGGDTAQAMPFAAALEMIHAYSLVHDDLPAMDNDTLRRGKPTNHVVFGEAMAILAGDGLLTHAFEIMAASKHPNALTALGALARAAGIGGMLAGQTLDITMAGQTPERETVRAIHLGKTSALFIGAMEAGLLLAGAADAQLAAGRLYGEHFGLAFQIVDDLLDLDGDPALMGKTLGKDQAEGKMTWVACVGAAQARLDAKAHIDAAVSALNCFGDRAEFLRSLALSTLSRVQ